MVQLQLIIENVVKLRNSFGEELSYTQQFSGATSSSMLLIIPNKCLENQQGQDLTLCL